MEQKESNGFETAARWSARLGALDCSPGEREEFALWLAARPENKRAYRRVERFQKLATLLPEELLHAPLPAAVVRAPASRRARWAMPLAACAAGLAFLAWISDGTVNVQPPQLLSNLTQASRRVTLADGSIMHLDAGGDARVEITDETRQIDLVAGRALFEVAHDSTRPFAVRAGASETVATGTVFQVERHDGQVQITLASGSVTVSGRQSKSSWQEHLQPGTQLEWDSSLDAPVMRQVDAEVTTGWTSGRHNFRDAPLHQVVAELNRYDSRKITLGDARLADLNVGGSYISGDNRAVVEALQIALPIRAEERGREEIVLLPR